MDLPKRSTFVVGSIGAMFVALLLLTDPNGLFAGRGTSCTNATNCEASAHVMLIANLSAGETSYEPWAPDIAGFPLLASLFDALGNTSSHPTARAIGPGEIEYGLREGQASQWMQFLSAHIASNLRYQGRTSWVSISEE